MADPQNMFCPKESAPPQYMLEVDVFEMFGAKLVLYLSLVFIAMEFFRNKSDPNARLRKLMRELLDCGMDEDLCEVLKLMERYNVKCKDPTHLSSALRDVEAKLQENFPAFSVQIDSSSIMPQSSSILAGDNEDIVELLNDGSVKQKKDKSGGGGENVIPTSFYWDSLYSVLSMIVHRKRNKVLERLNCDRAFVESGHEESFPKGSFDRDYFCRCKPTVSKVVHESLITYYEQTIGSYFLIQKVMNGIIACFHLDFGGVFKCFYDAWQFQGEINFYAVPVFLLLSSILIDSETSSYEHMTGGWDKCLPTPETFSHGVGPVVVQFLAITVTILCYAYAFRVLVSYSWKESSVAYLITRTWPGKVAVDWIVSMMVLNALITHPNLPMNRMPRILNRVYSWKYCRWLVKYDVFVELVVKSTCFFLQASVSIAVLALFLSPPFDIPYSIQEFTLAFGTTYWLYENVNVHWSDSITVVERCCACVVVCLSIVNTYNNDEALSLLESFILYIQMYLILDIMKDSWFRTFSVADLKPDLYLLTLLHVPGMVFGIRSSLTGFVVGGIQDIVQFCFKPDFEGVQEVTDLYFTWLDFVVLKCGGMYFVSQATFMLYLWILGDLETHSFVNDRLKESTGKVSSSSKRRKKRNASKSRDDLDTPIHDSWMSWLPSHVLKTTRKSNVTDGNRPNKSRRRNVGKRHGRRPPAMSEEDATSRKPTSRRLSAASENDPVVTQDVDASVDGDSVNQHVDRRDVQSVDDRRRAASLDDRLRAASMDDEEPNAITQEKSDDEAEEDHKAVPTEESPKPTNEVKRLQLSSGEAERRRRKEKQQRKKERRQERQRKGGELVKMVAEEKSSPMEAPNNSSPKSSTSSKDSVKDDNSAATSTTAPKTKEAPKPICVPFLSNNCTYGDNCRRRHPSPQEVTVLKERYAKTPCRWGSSCNRKNCHFLHPSKPSKAAITPNKIPVPPVSEAKAWTSVSEVQNVVMHKNRLAAAESPGSPMKPSNMEMPNRPSPRDLAESRRPLNNGSGTSSSPGKFVPTSSAHGGNPGTHTMHRSSQQHSWDQSSGRVGGQDYSLQSSHSLVGITPDEQKTFRGGAGVVSTQSSREYPSSGRNDWDGKQRQFTEPNRTGGLLGATAAVDHDRGVNGDRLSRQHHQQQLGSSRGLPPLQEPLSSQGRGLNNYHAAPQSAFESPMLQSSLLYGHGPMGGVSQQAGDGRNGGVSSGQASTTGLLFGGIGGGGGGISWAGGEDAGLQPLINFDELLEDPSESMTNCDVCNAQTRNLNFSPCGHMCFCTNCEARLGGSKESIACRVCKMRLSFA